MPDNKVNEYIDQAEASLRRAQYDAESNEERQIWLATAQVWATLAIASAGRTEEDQT